MREPSVSTVSLCDRGMTCVSCSYNPTVDPSLTIPSGALALDVPSITEIYFSCILGYNDTHIVNLNPAYAAQLNATSELITQNLGCGTTSAQAPISYAILNRMVQYQAAHPEDVALADCVNGYTEQLYNDWYDCVSVPSLGLYYAPTETTVPPLVLGTPGAMGMMVVDGDPSYGVPTMVVQRSGETVSTTSDVASIAACAQGTWDAATLSFDTNNPVNVTCWPWYEWHTDICTSPPHHTAQSTHLSHALQCVRTIPLFPQDAAGGCYGSQALHVGCQ